MGKANAEHGGQRQHSAGDLELSPTLHIMKSDVGSSRIEIDKAYPARVRVPPSSQTATTKPAKRQAKAIKSTTCLSGPVTNQFRTHWKASLRSRRVLCSGTRAQIRSDSCFPFLFLYFLMRHAKPRVTLLLIINSGRTAIGDFFGSSHSDPQTKSIHVLI